MTKKNGALAGFLIGFMLTMGMCAVETQNKEQFTSVMVVALIVGGIFGILGSLIGKDEPKDQSTKPPIPPNFRL